MTSPSTRVSSEIREGLVAGRRIAVVEIETQHGWKVSAPDQPSGAVLKPLAATWVAADGEQTPAALEAQVKTGVYGEFGKSLSGLQTLFIAPPSMWQHHSLGLQLELQVCSSSLCLLPEDIQLAFPAAQ